MNITQTLAQELALAQITAAVALLDDGATVRPLPQRSDGRTGRHPTPHQIISMTKQRKTLPPVIKSGNNRDTVAWAYHPEPPATP